MLGKTLAGRYEIERVLGRGAMGVVHKAHDVSLNREVAIKVLPRQLADDPARVKRLHREAQAAARLNHPNIVKIHDVGSDGDHHFIAMEYVRGEDLYKRIKREGRLEVRDALRIAEQVVPALGDAHRQGVVHRDIKPQNVMIDKFDHVVVMDFGIAKLLGDEQATELTDPGVVLGTPAYMSPEQMKGETVDGRSDLWAVGVLLYHMMTGKLPFRGGDQCGVAYQFAILHQIVNDNPEQIQSLNRDVPGAVAAVVERALRKDKAERFQTAEELDAAIKEAITGRTAAGLDTFNAKTAWNFWRFWAKTTRSFLR